MKKIFLLLGAALFSASALAQNVSHGPVTKITSGANANKVDEDLIFGGGRTLSGAGTFDLSLGTLTLATNQVAWVKVNKSGSNLTDIVTRAFASLQSIPTTFAGYGLSDTSANFATALSDETGSGFVVFSISPALTGTPTTPTAAVDTSTTQVASTAFVLAQSAAATPLMDGSAAVGSSTRFARGDHVHPTDTSRAPLASPSLTGAPLAPTPAANTNTTQISTTAYVTTAIAARQLQQWTKGGISGKKVVFAGDSTTSNATALFTRLAEYQAVGGPLEGTTIVNQGNNGATIDAFLADSGSYGITAAIAAAPDLIVFDYLINNARLGESAASMQAKMITAITSLRSALPNCPIVLRMPATFLTTDVGAAGFVVPNGSAQTYSDNMATVYRALAATWPNVVLLDTHKLVWGDTCPATSVLMADQLHPIEAGQRMEADAIVSMIGTPPPYNPALAYAARAASATAPWTVYQRAVEDPYYFELVYSGAANASGGGFFRLATSLLPDGYAGSPFTNSSDSILIGDVIAPQGLAPFVTTVGSIWSSDGIIQVSMTSPVTLTAGMPVKVYRPRWFGDETVRRYWQDAVNYPRRIRVYVLAGGSGYFDLGALDPKSPADLYRITTSDTIVIAGQSAITSFTFGNSGYIRVFKTGDWTALAGKGGYVFGANNMDLTTASPTGGTANRWRLGSYSAGKTDVEIGGAAVKVRSSLTLRTGTAVLVAGTVTVSDAATASTTRITLSLVTPGGTVGAHYVSAKTNSTSFVITSTSGSDTSTIYYEAFEP